MENLIEVYFYLPEQEAATAVECGIKLSRWFDKEVLIDGEKKKCICSWLNPKDDIEKYRSEEYRCLKLQLMPKYCFVADRYLYDLGMGSEQAMEMYLKSIIPVERYIFGSYRLPECLVTSTVLAGHISPLNKRLDTPVLFDNSEELYINNIIVAQKEDNDDFNDAMLYFFYCKMAQEGKVNRIEDASRRIAVFADNRNGKTVTIKIPDMDKY